MLRQKTFRFKQKKNEMEKEMTDQSKPFGIFPVFWKT
jgi:hypothetical protein